MKNVWGSMLKRGGLAVARALGTLWMAWALYTQFAIAEEFPGHYLIFAALFALCWIALGYAARRAKRWQVLALLPWGAGLAFACVIGKVVAAQEGGIWPYEAWQTTALRIAGLAGAFALPLICWMAAPPREQPSLLCRRSGTARTWFFAAWAIIAISRLPYWLTFHPAVMTYDTVVQYTEALGGTLTNKNPLLHTLTIGLALRLGAWVGLGEAASLAGYALAQVLVQAAVFAGVVAFLRRRAQTLWAPLLALAYFALHPLHAYYAVTIWKDVPFGLIVLALVMMLYRVAETRGECLRKPLFFAGMTAVLALVPLLRNNGIFPMAAAVIALALWKQPERKRALALCGGAVAVLLIVQVPVFRALRIEQSNVTEMLAVPLQQIGFVVKNEYMLSDEQAAAVDEILPLDAWAENYYVNNVDPLKHHPDFDHEALRADLGRYAQVWREIGKENPEAFQEAYAAFTMRYWYPDRPPQARFYPNPQPAEQYKYFPTQSLTEAFAGLWDLSPKEWVEAHPQWTLLYSQGALIWLVLAACACLLAAKKARFQLALWPLIAVWVSLMLGAPLDETRYIYPLYCCVPLLVWLPARAKMEG